MANIKISELEELVNVADNDYFPIVDTSVNETKKVKAKFVGSGGKSGDTLPIGSIVPYGDETAPANWLICDGSAISRTTYADLFAIIGTKFGSGDGTTTFNLPNLSGKVPVGLDENDNDFNTIGKIGGEKTHTLTIDEMPSHSHVGQIYSHNFDQGVTIPSLKAYINSYSDGQGQMGFAQNPLSDSEISQTADTLKTGSSQSHNNLQPYEVTNYIIKAFQSAGVIANVAVVKTESNSDVYTCNYINNLDDNKIDKESIKIEQYESDTDIYSCNYLNTQKNEINANIANISNKIKRYRLSSGQSFALEENKSYLIAVQGFTTVSCSGIGTVLSGYAIEWAHKINFECTNSGSRYTFSSTYGNLYILTIEI